MEFRSEMPRRKRERLAKPKCATTLQPCSETALIVRKTVIDCGVSLV